MAEPKPILARPLETWRKCDPHAMATRQSQAAIEFAFRDMKHDILALADLITELSRHPQPQAVTEDARDGERLIPGQPEQTR